MTSTKSEKNVPERPEKRKALTIQYKDKVQERVAKFGYYLKASEGMRQGKAEHLHRFITLPHKIVFMTAGNQGGKTFTAAYSVFRRIMGIHPIEDKNRLSKQIRCLSSSLPESSDAEEQDNTQYLELKKLIPYEAIYKDITARSKRLVVASPVHGKSYIEFVSTKQELQDTGKVQRDHLWMDEEAGSAYWDESMMRLHASNGDAVATLTPINGLSWCYDRLYLRASYHWRSKTIFEKFGLPREDFNETGDKNIAVVQIATDDNPTLSKESIDRIFEGIDDPDELAVRRYGIFRQISGRIHKAYNSKVHFISYNKYFPDGVPYEWTHVRGIDYHESRTPWSIGWLSISPDDEWFLWQELHPAIDGPRAMNTYEIAREIIRRSGDYYYVCNLIDPLANKKQANTLFSVTDDLNRFFEDFWVIDGVGTQAYWQGWDTKDTKGRDEIRKRFKNAVVAGVPFNNTVTKKGKTVKLPPLWICDTCPEFNKSIQRWSYGEWQTAQTKQVNDPKPQPQQRFSHDCMVLECLAKDARLLFAAQHKHYRHANVPYKTSLTGRMIRR